MRLVTGLLAMTASVVLMTPVAAAQSIEFGLLEEPVYYHPSLALIEAETTFRAVREHEPEFYEATFVSQLEYNVNDWIRVSSGIDFVQPHRGGLELKGGRMAIQAAARRDAPPGPARRGAPREAAPRRGARAAPPSPAPG